MRDVPDVGPDAVEHVLDVLDGDVVLLPVHPAHVAQGLLVEVVVVVVVVLVSHVDLQVDGLLGEHRVAEVEKASRLSERFRVNLEILI